jgi:hypothetical protein
MGRIIVVYGVIAGVTVALLMRVAMMLIPEGGTAGMVAGFSSMIVALSFVFVGVKRYRYPVREGAGGRFRNRCDSDGVLYRGVGAVSVLHRLHLHGRI